MTDIDIDAIRQRPLTDEPDSNTFVVWYGTDAEPYAVYFRSDANAWDEGERWFNADQRESDGEPSTWDDLCEDLLGNDGPHLLVPGARVDELTAALAERDAQLTAANRRADGLEADLRSARRGLTEYANQTAVVEDGETCGELSGSGGWFRCGKPAGHTGDRHHTDFGVGTYTWGYVPTATEAATR